MLRYAPVARPAGFHQVAVASSAMAVNAPAMACARMPTASGACADAGSGAPRSASATRQSTDTNDTKARPIVGFTLVSFLSLVLARNAGSRRLQPRDVVIRP